MMHEQHSNSSVPDWENINFITEDLKEVLDNFSDDSEPIPSMKVRLARVIAQMRDERGMEDRFVKQSQNQTTFSKTPNMTGEIRARLQRMMQAMGYK
ncbi:MAG: hypothetical protein ACTSUE_12130 [Promethearchaeota archaeon]